MRSSALALLALLLCSTALVACGGADSGSGGATKTATVPEGKLGAQGGEHCGLPTIPGVRTITLDVTGMDCGSATTPATQVIQTGRASGWSCSVSPSGGQTHATCRRDGNSGVTFSISWGG